MPESPNYYKFYVGSVGWTHPDWADAFYPPDLPQEWWLAFYNTQFECVLLRAEQWLRESPDTLGQWVADTTERFRFVLEMPEREEQADVQPRLAVLRPKLGLLVDGAGHSVDASFPGSLEWIDAQGDMKAMAARMQAMTAQWEPVFFIQREGDLGAMRQVATLVELLGY